MACRALVFTALAALLLVSVPVSHAGELMERLACCVSTSLCGVWQCRVGVCLLGQRCRAPCPDRSLPDHAISSSSYLPVASTWRASPQGFAVRALVVNIRMYPVRSPRACVLADELKSRKLMQAGATPTLPPLLQKVRLLCLGWSGLPRLPAGHTTAP